jgi:hypothetical protein
MKETIQIENIILKEMFMTYKFHPRWVEDYYDLSSEPYQCYLCMQKFTHQKSALDHYISRHAKDHPVRRLQGYQKYDKEFDELFIKYINEQETR